MKLKEIVAMFPSVVAQIPAIDACYLESLVISANDVPDMYRKLNTLKEQGKGGWRLLRSPTWVRGFLVAVLIRRDMT